MAFLRKLVRPRSFHFPLSHLFPRFLSIASNPLKIVSTGSFTELRESGGYYRDKTHFITKIEDLEARAILSLRPRKNPTKLASSFLVLKLNFAGLRTNSTFEIFEGNFHTILNVEISKFMNQYQQELGRHFQVIDENTDALGNFGRLLNAVILSGHKLYVCIDEYDGGMNEALKNETLLQVITNHHKNEGDSAKSKIEKIESSFKQFYSRLKYACDEGIAHVFQTGVTPVAMAEFTSGFNISKDLALREEFWDLYGFKKSEIELLLDNSLGLPSDVKGEIMEWLKEENDGYFFNSDQTEGIFNPARVLYCIEMLMGKKKKLIDDDYINYCK
ncbi:7172_t:CDS:2 [Paraglomus brasilianum]|uniref:7172_t:CDS:1 n=1 Tax=Paraglomus brasilianum TaxID=144538 RepID=A0A9N9FSK6_9GLOM|nr:7172_t:CDS:2 [Paraglomus brasilianum]